MVHEVLEAKYEMFLGIDDGIPCSHFVFELSVFLELLDELGKFPLHVVSDLDFLRFVIELNLHTALYY